MHRAFSIIAAVSFATACAPSDACDDCAISAVRIATFGDADGDGALEGRPLVSAAFGGMRIVLQPEASRELPRLYTAEGRFLHTLGADGDGPHEFRSPSRVLIAADSAWIIDRTLRRATVIDATGRLAHSVSWQRVPFDATRRPDGTWVVAGGSNTRRSMAIVSASGAVLQEFGDSSGPFGTRRHVVQQGSRTWSAQALYRLRFEEWSAPDSLRRVVEPTTPHFPPYEQLLLATDDRPPMPSLRGFWLDSLARIWAVIEVPAATWRSGYGETQSGEGGQPYRPMRDPNLAYATVVLVIEPSTGRILTERTLDGWFYAVVEPFVLQRAVQTADGWYQAELWRVDSRTP